MKKIAQIVNYMYPHIGGIEQLAREIFNVTSDEYENKVICFNHEKGDVVDYVDGVEIHRVGCQAKISSQSIAIHYKKRLAEFLKAYQPDVVIFHFPNPYVAACLMPFLKNRKFKFVVYYHLDIFKQKILKLFFTSQTRKLLEKADKIVATSPNYIKGSPFLSKFEEKCVVIPSCIDESRLECTDDIKANAEKIRNDYKGKTLCFAFGRHVPYKGIGYLVKASKYLNNDFQIVIGGSGPLTEKLKNEAADDKKVLFIGKVNDDVLKSYLLACDIFCFPSITKNEAFGLGLAEAMYYGKPAITFTIEGSGVNYVSIANETGLEVENGDCKKYADAIRYLASNPTIAKEYGNNAKKRVQELFGTKEFGVAIKRLIESL